MRLYFFLFLTIFLFIGAYFSPYRKLFLKNNSEQIVQEKKELELLLETSQKLAQAWRNGDTQKLWAEGKIQCPQSLGSVFPVGEDYLKCNPLFLSCLFEANYFEGVELQRPYELLTKANSDFPSLQRASYLFEIRLKKKNKVLPLLLENDCHEVFLPERFYKYGKSLMLWDNFSKRIFVDKFPMTFLNIGEWLKFSEEKIPLPKEKKELAQYAYGLTFSQMEKACAFYGKELMSAEVFDAASFYPADITNAKDENFLNAPYPWTRKKNFVKSEVLCKHIFSEECLKDGSYQPFSNSAPTWSGMFLSLGGPLEAMRNFIESEKNLKASSFYFPLNSSWHKLGERAKWDGNDFGERNFDWGKNHPPHAHDFYQVTFRCVRREK